jgi:hypothetical protein
MSPMLPVDAPLPRLSWDIGAIGYYSDAYVFDAAGLVWKDRDKYRSVGEMVLANQPDYVMLTAMRSQLAMTRDPRFQASYAPALRIPNRPGERLDTNPDHYPDTWRQEYLIFKRRPP